MNEFCEFTHQQSGETIGAQPGQMAIVVTLLYDRGERTIRSAPIIGWKLKYVTCNENETVPILLGEQAEQEGLSFMNYIGVVLVDGRLWWRGQFFDDQDAFLEAIAEVDAKRRKVIAERERELAERDKRMAAGMLCPRCGRSEECPVGPDGEYMSGYNALCFFPRHCAGEALN